MIFTRFGNFLKRHFWFSVFVIMAAKLFLAAVFPITSDEAYFWQWGRHLAMTYYDHSMMAGLWMYLGQILGAHIFFQRFIAIVAFFLVFLILRKLVKVWSNDLEKADLVSLAFLVSPVHFLFFPISTDSPLFFFAFFAAICYGWAYRHEKARGFVAAGVFLGLALFSKYLIIFLALAMGVCLFTVKNKRRIPLYIGALFIGILPFVVAHFWLAQENCWWPLQFNVFNRSEGKSAEFGNLMAFFFQQVFLFTPWILWACFRHRSQLRASLLAQRHVYLLLFGAGLVFLGILSLFETGLHWGLSLYPLLYLSIWVFDRDSLTRILSYSAVMMTVVTLFVLGLLIAVPYVYVGGRYYADYVMGKHGDEVHQALLKVSEKLNSPVLGTLGYTTSGLMDYHSGTHYLVFKDIDTNGRNDDEWTDYRTLDGRDFLLISTYKYRPEELEEYQKYFDSVEYEDLSVNNGQFYLAIGRGFKYAAYRDGYLTWANQQFYQFRKGLPAGKCFFHEKYFTP